MSCPERAPTGASSGSLDEMEVAVLSPGAHWLPFQHDLALRQGWDGSEEWIASPVDRDDPGRTDVIICVTCPDYCPKQVDPIAVY